jgi:ferritin-like metal-binding protein YciE
LAQPDRSDTKPVSIDWNETIKKEARGINEYDLGEVQDVGISYIHTQKGIASKEQYYIPKYLVEGYDGATLWFKISETYALELIRNNPPLDTDYRTKYLTTDSLPDVEQRIPMIPLRALGRPPFVRDLLLYEMRDLYSSEDQLAIALLRVSDAAHEPQLKFAFQNHLEQTKRHMSRLQQAFEILGESGQGKSCLAMQGLIQESDLAIIEGNEMIPAAADLALITVAQKAEHYEISGYGNARMKAERLGRSDIAGLLQETEQEERHMDDLLTQAAVTLLQGTPALVPKI